MSLGEIAGRAEATLRTWMWGGGWLMMGGAAVALVVAAVVRARPLKRFWIWLAGVLFVVGFVLQPKAPGRL